MELAQLKRKLNTKKKTENSIVKTKLLDRNDIIDFF